jgi:hypothetical protein
MVDSEREVDEMTWFRVDDGMWAHPKFDELSDGAVALWVRAGSYCARYLTDGFVSSAKVPLLRGNSDLCEELVRAGLWSGIRTGFQFNDWSHYQASKADLENRRERWREEKRAKKQRHLNESPTESQDNPGFSAPESGPDSLAHSIPFHSIPSIPSPTEKDPANSNGKRARSKSGSLTALTSALKAELSKRGETAPALSHSLGQKAAQRVSEHAAAYGLTLDQAAAKLAASWAVLGGSRAWALCDVPFDPKASISGPARAGSRRGIAPGTTARDFENEPSLDEQMATLRTSGVFK